MFLKIVSLVATSDLLKLKQLRGNVALIPNSKNASIEVERLWSPSPATIGPRRPRAGQKLDMAMNKLLKSETVTPLVLAAEIKRAFSRKGLTLTRAANAIGVPGATLRTWIDRNRFPEYGIEKICQLLDWDSPQEVAKKYGISEGWAKERSVLGAEDRESLIKVLEIQDAVCARTHAQLKEDNIQSLCRSFTAMGENDIFVLASLSVMPMAFEKQNWGPLSIAIAEGAVRGGTCLYLFPCQALVSRIENEPWNFNKMISADTFRKEFVTFTRNVEDYLVLKERVDSRKMAQAITQKRIVMAEYTDSPFLAPGFAIGMFQTMNEKKQLARRMMVRVPTDFGGVLYLPEEKDDLFTWRFLQFVNHAVQMDSEVSDREAIGRVCKILGSEFLPK